MKNKKIFYQNNLIDEGLIRSIDMLKNNKDSICNISCVCQIPVKMLYRIKWEGAINNLIDNPEDLLNHCKKSSFNDIIDNIYLNAQIKKELSEGNRITRIADYFEVNDDDRNKLIKYIYSKYFEYINDILDNDIYYSRITKLTYKHLRPSVIAELLEHESDELFIKACLKVRIDMLNKSKDYIPFTNQYSSDQNKFILSKHRIDIPINVIERISFLLEQFDYGNSTISKMIFNEHDIKVSKNQVHDLREGKIYRLITRDYDLKKTWINNK
jgi:hypothetical protein